MRRVKADNQDCIKAFLSQYNRLEKINWMPTGIHALDLAIGGGIPMGRIIEVFGGETGGKSVLGWTIIKAFQKAGGYGMMLDVEATTPEQFIQLVGVDLDNLAYEWPETVEEARDYIVNWVNGIRKLSKGPLVVMLDSVAAISAEGEWAKEDGKYVPRDNDMASRAQAIADFFKQHTVFLARNNVTLLCLNQLRDKIGIVYGRKTDSPGGHSLKHAAIVRLELSRGKKIEPDGKIIGINCHARVEKNKAAAPFRKAELQILWGKGYDPFAGLVDVLVAAGRIQDLKGGEYQLGETKFKAEDIASIVEKNPVLLEPWL